MTEIADGFNPLVISEALAARQAFLEDLAAEGAEAVTADEELATGQTSRETIAAYKLPTLSVQQEELPVVRGPRACLDNSSAFVIDRFNDDGDERPSTETQREIAAAQAICSRCIALESCSNYAEALQTVTPRRNSADQMTYFVIMAKVAYARR